MKMSIQEVFNLMCEFKTYPELDMMVTLKYSVFTTVLEFKI